MNVCREGREVYSAHLVLYLCIFHIVMELIRLYKLTLLCRVMPCYGDLGRHTPTRNIARLCWERAVQLSGVVSFWSEVFQTWNCTLPSVNEARHASDVWWVSESIWINHEISAHIAWPRLLLERTCFQRHNMLLFCAELAPCGLRGRK